MSSIGAIRGAIRRSNPAHKAYGPITSVSVLRALWRRYCEQASMRRSRDALRGMSDVQLRDIGITRADAEAELRKNDAWM